jgi:hypothetical protein
MRAVSRRHVCSRSTCVCGFLACVFALAGGRVCCSEQTRTSSSHDAQARKEDGGGTLRGRRLCVRLRCSPELLLHRGMDISLVRYAPECLESERAAED